MHITVDLHSHSGASGGVGHISLLQVAESMALKGIDIFGTGDCLHDGWLETLTDSLTEAEPGLFALEGDPHDKRFLLQTEVIFTADIGRGRKTVHTLLLFPSLAAVKEVGALCDSWGVKRTIGRPFIACQDPDEVAERALKILQVDESICLIPAHVLTPQGIYGSNRPVTRLGDFYGEAADHIHVVETGLSADPQVLALIPELDTRTLISNSDGHSGALNRVGREYTTLDLHSLRYDELVSSLRSRKVIRTAEFTPAEGRFFLSGHRAGKKGHEDGQYCYFSPDRTPESGLCPICGKALTIGVLERALELSTLQGGNRSLESLTPSQPYLQMIPLVEAIAASLGVKSCTAKRVVTLYHAIIQEAGNEALFWAASNKEGEAMLKQADAGELLEG
ncbi:MAG: endonuclease Q family protein, partial [Planctomycetota bacterium]